MTPYFSISLWGSQPLTFLSRYECRLDEAHTQSLASCGWLYPQKALPRPESAGPILSTYVFKSYSIAAAWA